jgi:OmpA-OmpF porin, OOP family
MKRIVGLLALLLGGGAAMAQLRNPLETVERGVQNRANSRVNQGVNKGIGKADNAVFGKKKKDKPTSTPTQPRDNADNNVPDDVPNVPMRNERSALSRTYGAFDFLPAEKLLVNEDFIDKPLGDFPAGWNTNSSGEIVTIKGVAGHWLTLGKQGVFLPEFITDLPDHFTLQFDLACSNLFSPASSGWQTAFAALKKPTRDYTQWSIGSSGENGVSFTLHPIDEAGKQGSSTIQVTDKGQPLVQNESGVASFFAKGRNLVNVSIWRQGERLRVYVNEEKVWDLPRAFQPRTDYNALVFSRGASTRDGDNYYISNLRLAVGDSELRKKLLDKGKFSTWGILFGLDSDKIRPASYGVLKEVASILTENPRLDLQIIGYTDNEADEQPSLALSKRRAEAVRATLITDFGIAENRLTATGRGNEKPTESNKTPEGRANNRRIEFVAVK